MGALKATPGPWGYCECGCGFIGGGDDEVCKVTVGKWGDVGVHPITGERSLVHHWGTIPPERAEANARLIASAPELYEALDAIRSMLAGYAGQPNHLGDVFKIADAAIAKASGDIPSGRAG